MRWKSRLKVHPKIGAIKKKENVSTNSEKNW